MTHGKEDKPNYDQNIHQAEEEFNYYDNLINSSSEVLEAMQLLEEQRPITLDNIKDSCIHELQRFIDMRGSIDNDTGKIHLTLISKNDQNSVLTTNQIQMTDDLIKRIAASTSIDVMKETLQNAPRLGSDFEAMIVNCLHILQKTEGHNPSQKL